MADTSIQGPSARTRKTHTSAGVIAALKRFASETRRKMNLDIEARNAQREYAHAKHVERPADVPDASDDESLITVTTIEEQLSPVSKFHQIMQKLSPKSGKDLLRSFPFLGGAAKRPREEEAEARRKAKKIREEIVLQPGMSLPVAFNAIIFDLHAHNIYLPLSLFTSQNLEVINSSAATLPTLKLNAEPGCKQPVVLNTEAFELKYLKELDLERAQWIEASSNYIAFLTEASGSAVSTHGALAMAQRHRNHHNDTHNTTLPVFPERATTVS
ncbi:hypothetical protein B0H15DRAFT_970470 [Mycena belliarum]|uniref:Uncharacterized protein n=1 Tax=Mycena belliarum TaxID=1033014 RepID=A0AAD6XG04_9AGAR|nr:hypothetical protein B0H15DRAFT_970470 [Mycena belliae]